MHVMFVWELFWLWIYPSAVYTNDKYVLLRVCVCVRICTKCEVLRKFHVVFENDRSEDRIFSLFSVFTGERMRQGDLKWKLFGVKMLCMDNRDVVRAMLVYWNVFFFSFCWWCCWCCTCFYFRNSRSTLRIKEPNVHHHQCTWKWPDFFFSPLSLFLALVFRPFFFPFYLPFPTSSLVLFTSNWWCDIYKMISIFDLIGWLFELLQMDIKSNKFVYWFFFFWRFDQKIK